MTRTSSPDPTIDRIVTAATAEFARHGIAGARIERIAKAARTSKERVYAHFRGKEALYRFVAGRELTAMAEAVEIDPADLPGYAGRLFDHALEHPERHRLVLWGQLEDTGGDASEDDPLRSSLRDKIEKLRAAQQAGLLEAGWAPEDVLVLVTQLATSWATQSELAPRGSGREAFLAERRAAVVAAVGRIFPVADGDARRA